MTALILRVAAGVWAAFLVAGYAARVFSPGAWLKAMSVSAMIPIDPGGFLSTWAGHAGGAAVCAVWLLCAAGWGGREASLILIGKGKAGAPGVLSVALGLAAMGVAALGLGFLGLMRPAALVLLVLPAVPDATAWLKRARGIVRTGPDPVSRLLTGLTAVLLFVYLPAALAPERGWDALTYHLLVPDRFLDKGRVVLLAHVPWSFFPLMSEMWFTLARAFGGDPAARMLNFSFLPLTALALARTGRGRTGLLAALIFVSLPATGMVASQCYVDLELAWLCLVAFTAALRPGSKWLVASAALAGTACGCKYSGSWVLGLCGAAWLARGRLSRRTAGEALAGAALAGLVFAPWAARNWIATGNPVFPLLTGIFSGTGLEPYYSAEQAARVLPLGGSPGLVPALLGVLRFPAALSWEIRSIGVISGALLFAFLPILFLPGTASPRTKPFALAGLTFSAMWVVTGAGDGRFLLPAFALLVLPSAEAASRVAAGGVLSLFALAITAAAGLLFQAAHWTAFVSATYAPWLVAAGLEPRDLHLARAMLPPFEHMAMARVIQKEVPRRSRILIASDLVAYYYGRDAVFDAQQVSPPASVRVLSRCASPDEMRKRFRQLGIDHVLYTPRTIMFERACGCVELGPGAGRCYEGFWRRYGTLSSSVGTLKLYRLKSEAEARRGGKGPLLDLPVLQDRLLTRAQNALEARDSRAQGEALRELRRRWPDLASGAVKLAWYHLDRNEFSEARREIEAAGRLGADDGEYWLGRALITGASGDLTGALEAARRGAAKWPGARPLTIVAGVAFNAGRDGEAREALEEAAKLDPTDAEVRRVGAILKSRP